MSSLYAQPGRGLGAGRERGFAGYGSEMGVQRGRGLGAGMGMGPGMGRCLVPDLTAEQETAIQKLRTEHYKAVLPLSNSMAEKEARLQTLRTADNPDNARINKLIEEIGSIRTDMMKKAESHRQKVRKLLTDDQKVLYDRQHSRMGRGRRQGRGRRW